jgi:prepilin-type N-terminal cleavage/methylation domain-containing protein
MPSSPSPDAWRGYTLLELAVALLVIALLTSMLSLPLAAQLEMRRGEETRRRLEEARDVLLAFAATHGRLPCPASATSRGEESFEPGGDASNGLCAHFTDGWVPAAALGLAPMDSEGYLRDAWDSARNRVRYAVYGGDVNGVVQALTRTDGLQAATLAAIGAQSHYLFVCAAAAGASAAGCGPATNQLTRRAAFVLLSTGANAIHDPVANGDEARNLAGDGAFVAREASDDPRNPFDDLVQWTPVHLVVHRMLAAGRLP